jgi:hypothetical protein
MGIFTNVPQLSFDVDLDEGSERPFDVLHGAYPTELLSILKDFQERFTSLKTKWTQTFLEVDSSHAIVVKDLRMICKRIHHLKLKLSTISENATTKDALIASQLSGITSDLQWIEAAFLHSTTQVQSIQHEHTSLSSWVHTNQEEQDLQIQTLQSSFSTLETKLATVDRYMKEFDKWFTIIFPILKEIQQVCAPSDFNGMDNLRKQLLELSEKVNSVEQMAWQQINQTPSPTSVTHLAPPMSLEADLIDLRHQMKILQHGIIGGGVKIGSKVFQSFEDVQVWLKAELPTRRYGLFVDAVSILDFFSCLGHIDAENQVSTLHNANKVGFTSIYESRVATSVQNIFPKVFGKGDSHQYLPAIRNPDRWDDGTDGLVYQITRGMTDVETQLSSAIDSVLEHYPEARSIASQCLFKAKRFVVDLCTFMSKDYFKWMAHGHNKQDSWNMTSLCVRWVFEEIHSERVVAWDIYDPNDLEFTTAKMLWATWKAHGVMEQYLRHHFYEHPSISAVLARHLVDNYIKPTGNHPGAQVSALEKLVKSHSSCLDKLENRKGKGKPKDKEHQEEQDQAS